ncbi:helix-turn-helix domain-containing protein [Nakamurella sp. GG22]
MAPTDTGRIAALSPPPMASRAVPSMVGYCAPPVPGVHRGLPSPYLTVVFPLSGELRIDVPDAGGHRTGRFAIPVGGLHTEPVLLPQPDLGDRDRDVQRGVQLAVHPFAARALLGLPAAELGTDVVELADVLDADEARVADLTGETSGAIAVQGINDWIDRRLTLAPRHRIAPELLRAWHLIVESGGRRRVADVARDVGWSRRHLTVQLRTEIGIGAKDLARLARFHRARSLLLQSHPPLADLATICGYADQAHLTAEWRRFAGCTPGQWIAEELPGLAEHASSRRTFAE